MLPTAENSHSDGVEVPGTPKYVFVSRLPLMLVNAPWLTCSYGCQVILMLAHKQNSFHADWACKEITHYIFSIKYKTWVLWDLSHCCVPFLFVNDTNNIFRSCNSTASMTHQLPLTQFAANTVLHIHRKMLVYVFVFSTYAIFQMVSFCSISTAM